jgi:K+/H+ antiporter YhaU regulatory subunit KhtT
MMIIDRKVSSIESSFQLEDMLFNEECRKRVKDVLEKNISVADTIAELNKKYSVLAQKMEDQENVLSDSEGT